MIDRGAIEQIIAQYVKHGWTLRRVLLSKGSEGELDKGVFNEIAIEIGDLNALWFSRSSRPDSTAWELRHLSGVPYALVTGISTGTDEEAADLILKDTERRMIAALDSRKPSGN